MSCYRKNGCGPYDHTSCSACPASRPDYAEKSGDENAFQPEALHSALVDTKCELTAENREKAEQTLKQLTSQLQLLSMLVKTDAVQKADVEVHLGLLRHAFNDLNEIFTGSTYLDEQLERAYADLRQANKCLRELQNKQGSGIDGESLSSAIRFYDNAFATWYELTGFHYASVEFIRSGIVADFSEEIYSIPNRRMNRLEDISFGDKETAQKVMDRTPNVFEDKSMGWDMSFDGLRGYLLDTDNNRRLLMRVFETAFPGCRISRFSSRSDRHEFHLSVKVFVPFTDISSWLNG